MTRTSVTTSVARSVRVAASLIALGGAAACSDSTAVRGASANQLAFSLASPTATNASAAVVPITKGGHTLDLAQVSVTVARAELKRTHDNVCEDEADDDDHGDRHGDNSGPGSGDHDDDCER